MDLFPFVTVLIFYSGNLLMIRSGIDRLDVLKIQKGDVQDERKPKVLKKM